MMMKAFLPYPSKYLLLILSLLAASSVPAATERVDGYTFHYTVVNSTFISPSMAERYGITRSQRQAFLNISVQRNLTRGRTEAIAATLSGTKRNLMQQEQEISFMEIREGDSIYYIGQFEFSNAEPVTFELSIQPEGSDITYPLTWNTRVYTNN